MSCYYPYMAAHQMKLPSDPLQLLLLQFLFTMPIPRAPSSSYYPFFPPFLLFFFPLSPLQQGSSNGKSWDTYTCHISSWRSQLFLGSVYLREVYGLSVFLSMVSYTRIQRHIISQNSCTPCRTCTRIYRRTLYICIFLHKLSHTKQFYLNSPHVIQSKLERQQTVQYGSPGGPSQTCLIIWAALSIVPASFDKFTSN